MSTLEMKIRIIDQIIHLSDDSLVMEINSLLSFHNSESEIELSPAQLANIKESEAQIAAGQFNESNTLWNKVDSWLDQK
ncbi:MAG: hypothetical protein FGM41_00850 [Bacteroidetes bacterium]|jgi:hypothetical protein|nr:hypothetical protein [Bacteroidota bacterium]